MNIEHAEKEIISHLEEAEKMLTSKKGIDDKYREQWLIVNHKIIKERKKFVANLARASLVAKVRRLKNRLDKMKTDELKNVSTEEDRAMLKSNPSASVSAVESKAAGQGTAGGSTRPPKLTIAAKAKNLSSG